MQFQGSSKSLQLSTLPICHCLKWNFFNMQRCENVRVVGLGRSFSSERNLDSATGLIPLQGNIHAVPQFFAIGDLKLPGK